MADNEDYFPRGGKKPTAKFFKQSSNFLGAPEKAEKKKKKLKKKSEEDDGYLSDEAVKTIDESYRNCGVWLKYSVVKEGLLLLGRVSEVQETRIHVNMPCRLSGTVMACHISEPYNKLLEAYVNDQIDKVKDLQEMFRPGQYVALKVLEVAENHLMVSMMPQHVNSGKTQADLHKGALLQAAVSSVEDHGYVMDIGIPNVTAFLPKTVANPEIDLDKGMLTWCCIKSLTSSADSCVVSLSNELAALQKAFQKKSSGTLLPGNALDFTVDKPLENGIEGRVLGDRTAYIQRQHVDKINGKKPQLGQRVRARVLYVLPATNAPFLTMRDVFAATYPDLAQEQRIQEGAIVDDAQVIKISGRTVYMRLGAECTGMLSLRRLQSHEDLHDEQLVAKSYPLGSTHRVRVLRYNLCDYSYSVTDERSVLDEKYFSLCDLTAGQTVDGTVAAVAPEHVVVRVGRLSGYVPHAHMTDAGVFVDPKKASTSQLAKKKFKVGQPVRARVLSVDATRRTLFLTLKPSLLAAAPLTSYHDAIVGRSYTGVVMQVRDYLLVSFFNKVQAYVPRIFVTADRNANIADAFHVGQIVNCTILRVDPETKKMSASLITAPFTPKEGREKPVKRKNQGNIEDTSNDQKPDKDISKKKKKELESSDNTVEASDVKKKKKKRKNDEEKENIDDDIKSETNVAEESNKNKSKESKKLGKDVIENNQDLQSPESNSKRKKKKKLEKENVSTDNETFEASNHNSKQESEDRITEIQPSTEESDAIETDFHEDSDNVLTPEDLGLIDMSDCETEKQFKKRVVSILKAIKNRTSRVDRIDNKIVAIENKGLTPKNKKYHTAMHMEKLVIQQRVKKLLEALKVAQDKLKELGYERNTDYKKKKMKNEISFAVETKHEEINDSSKSNNVNNDSEEKSKDGSKEEKKKLKRKLKDIKVVEELKPALEVPSAKDFWSTDAAPVTKPQEEDSSDSDDELEEEKPKKKRKKLSICDKEARLREEEERVRRLELAARGEGGVPRSSEQFERALLARPAASQLWIAYMAFHLQATEVEKARGVARRALAAVPFREEGERLNVWLALLNLEHRFGNKESQQKTLEEALQMNDPYQVHSKLLDIYVETGKHQELSALCELMGRKYRSQVAYTAAGAALYRAGLIDRARQLMQKAIAQLEKKDHVALLVSFAQLERGAGSRERAEALFEQVLAVYPRRVDVCAQYADMLAKSGHVDQLRQVMDRMTSLKLPARKMKVLYKKWIDIEERLGDSDHVERIRQRAADFIEKAKF